MAKRGIAKRRSDTLDLHKINKLLKKESLSSRDVALTDCLNGHLSAKDVQRNPDLSVLDNTYGTFSALVFQMMEGRLKHRRHSYLTFQKVKQALMVYLRRQIFDICRTECIEGNSDSIVMLLFDCDRDQIVREIGLISEQLKSLQGIHIYHALGHQEKSLATLYQSYLAALSHIDSQYLNNRKKIQEKGEPGSGGGNSFFYPLQLERRFINFTPSGDRETLVLIDALLERNSGVLNLTNSEWHNFLQSLIRTLNRIIVQVKQSKVQILGSNIDLSDYILSGSRIEQCDKIRKCVGKIVMSIHADETELTEKFGNKLLMFVKENMVNSDFSLHDVAEHFELSLSYISRIFKEQTGRNFKELLSIERVELAKGIIEGDPDITLRELSKRSGFNNTTTLLRTFKRYTGITPGKYSQKF